jgi:hypothetical protein
LAISEATTTGSKPTFDNLLMEEFDNFSDGCVN